MFESLRSYWETQVSCVILDTNTNRTLVHILRVVLLGHSLRPIFFFTPKDITLNNS